MLLRKGYENSSLCYFVKIKDEKELDYIIQIVSTYVNNIINSVDDEDVYVNLLYDNLKTKINMLGSDIVSNMIGHGEVFKRRRNFLLVDKKKYGLYIKILEVEDNNNILSTVGTKNTNPLCRKYKICNEFDIDIIVPYVEKSYSLANYNPIDLNNDIVKYYK